MSFVQRHPSVRAEPTHSSRVGDPLGGSYPHLERLLSVSPVVIYTRGPSADFPTTFISRNVTAMTGYSPEDFCQHTSFWITRVHPGDEERVRSTLAQIRPRRVIDYEYRFRHAQGHYLWLHDQVSTVRAADGRVVMLAGSWFDVTAHKRAEALKAGQQRVLQCLVNKVALKETLEELARTIEQQTADMYCSILILDPVTQRLRHGAGPSLPAEYNDAIDGLRIGPTVGSCGTAAYRGKRIVVEDTLTDPLWRNFRDLARRFGLRACWSQPIRGSSGGILGTFAMYYHEPRGPQVQELELIEQAADLAALAIERHRAEEALRQSERLASIGTLAAGIAHEINNPIGAILLAAQNALTTVDSRRNRRGARLSQREKQERLCRLLEDIVRDAERCGRIVTGVLQFAKKSPGEKRPIEVAAVIQRAVEMTRTYAQRRRASLNVKLGAKLPRIPGNAVELEQVFVNLIRNAVESGEGGVHVSITAEADDHVVRIQVKDTGRGMTEAQKAQIFDPFFTTRQREGGTGLGLSITHGIVISHRGTINVDSQSGRGTTITLELPAVSSRATEKADA